MFRQMFMSDVQLSFQALQNMVIVVKYPNKTYAYNTSNPYSMFLLSSPGPSFDSCRYLQQIKAASNEHSGMSLSSKIKHLVIRYQYTILT